MRISNMNNKNSYNRNIEELLTYNIIYMYRKFNLWRQLLNFYIFLRNVHTSKINVFIFYKLNN